MNRLFIDIETSPNVCFTWRVGYKIKIDCDNIIKERAIICICYKWEHEKIVKFLKWDKKQNDKKMVEAIIPVLNQADEIVGQNIERFDVAWIRTRAAIHGVPTNAHYKIIDTLQYVRRKMYFNSNKLDYLGKILGVGGKIKTEFSLWKKVVLNNDKQALNQMIKYCKRDVILLENVYHKLAEHMASQTHIGVLEGSDKWTCAKCGSSNVNLNLTRVSAMGVLRRQMICRKCGHHYTISNKSFQDYHAIKDEDKKQAKKLRDEV